MNNVSGIRCTTAEIPGTVEELAPLAREYGFDGLDVPEGDLGDEKRRNPPRRR